MLLPKHPPLRSRKHLDYVESLPCAGCGCRSNVVAAHCRIRTDGGGSMKPSDAWTTPLCFYCHITFQHQHGERTFWENVNPHLICIALAKQSPDPKVQEFAKTMIDRW